RLEGGDGAAAGAGEQGEGHDSSIALLDVGAGWHRLQHLPDLVDSRNGPVGDGLGDPRFLVGEGEVLGGGGGQSAGATWLRAEPLKERPQGTEGREDGGAAQPLPRAETDPF